MTRLSEDKLSAMGASFYDSPLNIPKLPLFFFIISFYSVLFNLGVGGCTSDVSFVRLLNAVARKWYPTQFRSSIDLSLPVIYIGYLIRVHLLLKLTRK